MINHLPLQKKLMLFYISAFLLTLIFFWFAVITVGTLNIKNREGYHVLITEETDYTPLISERLEKSGFFDEVVSKYNTYLEYSDFAELQLIRIDRIEKRFNQSDPRFDSFLQKAGNYFKAYKGEKEYSLFYLKSEAGYQTVKNVVASLIGTDRFWIMPEGENPLFNPFAIILYAIILFIFIHIDPKNIFLYLFHSVPWFFVIFINGRGYFFPSVIMLFVLRYVLFLMNQIIKKYINNGMANLSGFGSGSGRAILIAVLIIISFIVSALLTGEMRIAFYTVIFLIFYELSFIASVILYSFIKAEGYVHKIFYNVSIMRESKKKTLVSMNIYYILAVYILSAAIIPLYFSDNSMGIRYPVPVHIEKYPESGITLEYLKKMSDRNSFKGNLPDYPEYIKHLAWQIRLPYEENYSIPQNNENISISHYYPEKDNYRKEKITVNQFTDKWLIDNINYGKGKGLTGLMISEEGFIQAAAGSTAPAAPLLIPAIFSFLYPLTLIIVLVLRKTQKTGSLERIKLLIRRRKQQAA
jgi:hypothetical protein